jgi:hypothetical protein
MRRQNCGQEKDADIGVSRWWVERTDYPGKK